MYIEFPDGEADSVDWDDWPGQCFLFCDATFPFADGDSSCPACLTSPQQDAGLQVMEALDAEITRVVTKKITDNHSDEWPTSISQELKTLVQSISGGARFVDDDLKRDSYVDLAAYKEYLFEVVARSPTFMTETHGEDDGAPPGCTSAYRLYWDSDPSEALSHFIKEINKDAAALKAVSCEPVFRS